MCYDWELIVALIALFFSEILPFIDKNKGSVSYWIYYSLFKSGCLSIKQIHNIEEKIGVDIDGDGEIGEP